MTARPYDADVVVVGSGAGGSFVALGLTQAGLRVTLLERGEAFDYRKDYPMRYHDWERRPDVLAQSAAAHTPLSVSPSVPIPAAHRAFLKRYGIHAPAARQTFAYQRAYGVGGSTLRYQGEAHRFAEHCFKPQSRFGWGADWPISLEDLDPYYAAAERVLGVSGADNNPFKPRSAPFPNPAHPLSKKSQYAAYAGAKTGLHIVPNTLAIPTRAHQGRNACRGAGGCSIGCPFDAKSHAGISAVRLAEDTGNLQLQTSAVATAIECTANGSVSGIRFLHNGNSRIARGRMYVLAMGGIETPRLMLASQHPAYPHGVGNTHDLVGRHFMETVYYGISLTAGMPIEAYKGPELDARAWDYYLPSDETGLKSGFVLGVSQGGDHRGVVRESVETPGFGVKHRERLRARFGRRLNLLGIAEQTPEYANRLMLVKEVDRFGVPLAAVRNQYSAIDIATLEAMIEVCERWAQACPGAKVEERVSSYLNPAATHLAGSCRMAETPQNGVTDAYGQVFGVPNLYIADASVLPSQGAGDSPSLTIQALALRTAGRIARQFTDQPSSGN